MPTLVPGHTESGSRGFTLLETLVVLLIIGIIAAAASLSTQSHRSQRALQQDAQRLAHLLSRAHTEARAWDRRIQWRYDAQGYWFEPLPSTPLGASARWNTTRQDNTIFQTGVLRHRAWSDPERLRIHVEPSSGNLLTSDWRSGPQHILLSDGMTTFHVQRAPSGLYEVRP